MPTIGFGSRMESAETFSAMKDFSKKKSAKKQKAGAAGGNAKAAAAKKQRTDTDAVDSCEAERALSPLPHLPTGGNAKAAPRFRARGVSCHTCSSGSVGSHRAPLPDDYHFELPDPSTTATGKPTTYLIAASNTKGAQPMQAELGNPPACLSRVCPCSHTLIQRPYRFPRALSGAIKASYAGRPSVRTVSAATRSSIARATCKAQWQKDFWRLLLACVVVPRFRISGNDSRPLGRGVHMMKHECV